MSDHDFDFSLNIFILYYLNEYKGNTSFLDLIASNNSKDVESYLDAMSMTAIEWANYFLSGSEEVYKGFSLERDVLDYNFYDENYDIDIDSLFNIQGAENQYISPLLIYNSNTEDYKLEYKEDDLDYGYAIMNERLLNTKNLELKNFNGDTLSDEYIYTQIENHLVSKKNSFKISFLIEFYVIVVKHYFKENKIDSLKKATKDLLKLSNTIQLSQRNIYEISLLFMDINRFNVSLDFIKKMTD